MISPKLFFGLFLRYAFDWIIFDTRVNAISMICFAEKRLQHWHGLFQSEQEQHLLSIYHPKRTRHLIAILLKQKVYLKVMCPCKYSSSAGGLAASLALDQ